MTEQQKVQLLPRLFENIDDTARISVLHIGSALPGTVDFFAKYRCKLYFLDLFDELPFATLEEEGFSSAEQMAKLLQFPADTRFNLCLFWDVFNYLDVEAIGALMDGLRPYLSRHSRAHGFAVHNTRAPPQHAKFEIITENSLAVRPRQELVPGYAPHAQSRLKELLNCFGFERTVLLANGRLELLLRATL